MDENDVQGSKAVHEYERVHVNVHGKAGW